MPKKTKRSKLHRSCGAMASHMLLLEKYPSFRTKQMRLEESTARRRGSAEDLTKISIATIKTVVNVVYKTAVQNISDAQIASQMKALNSDFRATNPDRKQDSGALERARQRFAHPVQACQGHAHEDD